MLKFRVELKKKLPGYKDMIFEPDALQFIKPSGINEKSVAILQLDTSYFPKIIGFTGDSFFNLCQFIGILDKNGKEIYGGINCNGDYVKQYTLAGKLQFEGFIVQSKEYAGLWVIMSEDYGEIKIELNNELSYYRIVSSPELEGKDKKGED